MNRQCNAMSAVIEEGQGAMGAQRRGPGKGSRKTPQRK